jgi:magnesium-transporting ATPase (P-type)
MVGDGTQEVRLISLHETLNESNRPLFCGNGISTTKYSILTFLPKNLFIQFSRLANFYFLVVVLLLQFPWAPISASVAVMPLTIVIGITAVRDAVEDVLRWRSDQRINSAPAFKLISGAWQECRWDSLLVGDVVKVRKGTQIPADLLLLASSDSEGLAYVKTANLDGETNLKVRQAIPQTKDLTLETNLHRPMSSATPRIACSTHLTGISSSATIGFRLITSRCCSADASSGISIGVSASSCTPAPRPK